MAALIFIRGAANATHRIKYKIRSEHWGQFWQTVRRGITKKSVNIST